MYFLATVSGKSSCGKSLNVPSAIVIFVVPLHSKNSLFFVVCFVASSQFDNVNVYLTPYCTDLPSLVSVNFSTGLNNFTTLFVVVTSSLSTYTLILSVVNLLFVPSRYLSVPIKSTVTTLFVWSILMFSAFHNGSTTSTIFSSDLLPPGSFTPIDITFATFEFPDLSVATPAGMDMLIGPL